MFALGIIDKLEPEDLTGGFDPSPAPGSIDEHGNVGPIGGVPSETRRRSRGRAPPCSSYRPPTAPKALANAQPDLTLVRVETLAGALEELE